jgi:1-acyl-sn-glycerol-3-phosphate acyltransferase
MVIGGALLRVRRQRYYDAFGLLWARWIVWASGCPVRVEGLEHIDADSPQILAGNHQSWFDVPAIAHRISKTYHFVAKKELEKVFLFGPAWKAAGHISIDRQDRESALRSLDRAGEQLRAEASAVIIFPEGTRTDSDALGPFKKGAFMLAMHTGVPIVPFGIAGSRRVLPKGRWRMRRGPVVVRFGEPIPTDGYDRSDRDALMERVRQAVRRLRDEGRVELGPGELESPQEFESAPAPGEGSSA